MADKINFLGHPVHPILIVFPRGLREPSWIYLRSRSEVLEGLASFSPADVIRKFHCGS